MSEGSSTGSLPLTWGEVDIGQDESAPPWRFGTLRLHAYRPDTEVWLKAEHDGGPEGEWVRWHAPPGALYSFRPELPDRPIIVAPERPYRLPPRGVSMVFVGIPLVARLSFRTGGASQDLDAFPSIVLSDTWWGSFVEGELAYWVETRARRRRPEGPLAPHIALCPFRLVNNSSQALPVERFAVRLDYLSLFETDQGIWTDEVHVHYRGVAEGSEIHHTGKAHAEAGSSTRLIGPRTPPPTGLRAKTFGRLRALAGSEDR